MNILIVANHYAVCSARYAAAAFARLGHTVKHVGPAMGRDIWGLRLPERYVWSPDDVGDVERDFEADLYVVMDSDPAILNSMKPKPPEYTKPVVVWGVDNHVRDYRRDYFEHYFLAHRRVSVMAWDAPAPQGYFGSGQFADITHLPCCYDPTLHVPSAIPYEERGYDVCMIGFMYPQRWAVVKALREAGFKVLAGCGLVDESYVAAYHNSRISLCLSAVGDVALRVFETAAMGCVVMTDACPDLALLKPEGFWVLDDTDPATVVKAVTSVLHQPNVSQEMVVQSMAWAAPHTWDARATEIVGWCERRNS